MTIAARPEWKKGRPYLRRRSTRHTVGDSPAKSLRFFIFHHDSRSDATRPDRVLRLHSLSHRVLGHSHVELRSQPLPPRGSRWPHVEHSRSREPFCPTQGAISGRLRRKRRGRAGSSVRLPESCRSGRSRNLFRRSHRYHACTLLTSIYFGHRFRTERSREDRICRG
jgi:hypothetical protein